MSLRIIWLGFGLRVVVAFWNAYYGPVIGAGGDASGFHAVAVDFSRTLRPEHFHLGLLYAYGLGILYRLTYPSLFLGGVFSALAWVASACVLRAIMRLLEFRRPQPALVMWVYTLYPSSIILTGVTLREPYQLLSVNLALYAALKIYLHSSTRHWLLLIGAVVFGGMLQGGILAFGVFVAAATTMWILVKRRRRIGWRRVALAVPFAAVTMWVGSLLFMRLYNFQFGEGIAAAIESYQRGGLSIAARTHYKTVVNVDAGGLVGFVVVGLLQYLFEPMPWRPLAIIDIPTVLENLIRAVLLGYAVVALSAMRAGRRAALALVFVCYLALESLFSVGTVNWGTAARHHVPSSGLLIVCGFARRRRPAATVHESGGAAEPLIRAPASV